MQVRCREVIVGQPPRLSSEVPAPPFLSLQVMERDMQHREQPVPPSSTVPAPTSSTPGDGLRDRAVSSPAPQAEPQQGPSEQVLSPGRPIVVKKSYTEAKDGGVQRGTRPPDEYGYIITDQK